MRCEPAFRGIGGWEIVERSETPGNGVPGTCSVVRLLGRLPCVGRPGTVGRCDPVDAGQQGLYLLWRGNAEQPESGAEHSGRQVAQHEA
jgi:hypothetical protein